MNSQAAERICQPRVSTCHPAPTKDIQLDGLQAKQWLEYLEGLTPGCEHAETLAEFRNRLDDALWLAQWKREYVVMELELTAVASLIVAISSQEPSLIPDRDFEIQEDILATLANMPGWT